MTSDKQQEKKQKAKKRATSNIRIRDGKIYARVSYTKPDGSRKEFQRVAVNMTHAKKLCAELKRELEKGGAALVDGSKLTFNEVAEEYRAVRLVPAEYSGEVKINGLRSYKTPLGQLNTLKAHFGNMVLRSITSLDIEKFRDQRLRTEKPNRKKEEEPKKDEVQPKYSISTVNRELALLRTIFNFAIQGGWIERNPFNQAKGLIRTSAEKHRERVLSYEEEERLLAVAPDYLRAILICALDSAARKGEILRLQWKSVSIEGGYFTVEAKNSKTATSRVIPMTTRLKDLFIQLWNLSPKDPNGLVFGIQSDFKRSFATARKNAGLVDFKFHDCRHTATTRMTLASGQSATIKKTTGHKRDETYNRYVNMGLEQQAEVADALQSYNDAKKNELKARESAAIAESDAIH